METTICIVASFAIAAYSIIKLWVYCKRFNAAVAKQEALLERDHKRVLTLMGTLTDIANGTVPPTEAARAQLDAIFHEQGIWQRSV